MSRWASALHLLLVLAAIAAPAVAHLAGVKGGGTDLQNRALAKRPTLTSTTVWDGSFGKGFNDWIADTIPLRDKALKMDHAIDFHVFGDSPSTGAFFGKDGVNWRRERVVGGHRAGSIPTAMMMNGIDDVEAAFAAAGIPLHIVLSPTKASIYSEYLPQRYRVVFEATVRPTERALLKRCSTDPVLIDLWTPLLVEKERLQTATDLLDPTFAKLWRNNDDHWNIEAGRIQARAIVEHIEPGLWDEAKAPVFTDQIEAIDSELSRNYFKLDLRELYRGQGPSPLVSTSLRTTVLRDSTTPLIEMRSTATPTHVPDPRHILVVRDSFLETHPGRPARVKDAGMQSIAPFFERVVFLHWDDVTAMRKDLAAHLGGIDEVVIQLTQGNSFYLPGRRKQLATLAGLVKKGRSADSVDSVDSVDSPAAAGRRHTAETPD